MSGRSPSGVASLRARFEHSKGSTSPPSRGRSPAGSATSDISRPVSKVRTSFVSVEGSGKMSDQSSNNGTGDKVAVAGDGGEVNHEPLQGGATDMAQTNGESRPHSSSINDTTEDPTRNGLSLTDNKPAAMDGPSDANPDKPVSTAEEDLAEMLPADPKDEAAVSGGGSLGEKNTELGSILKGSPFEKDGGRKGTTTQSTHIQTNAASSPSKSPSKPSNNSLANGKPKGGQVTKSAAHSKPKDSLHASRAETKPTAVSTSPNKSNVPDSKLKASPRPAATGKTAAGSPASSNLNETPEAKASKIDANLPRTPTNTAPSTKQPLSTTTSPNPRDSLELKRNTMKEAKKPTNGPPAKSKPPTAAAAKPVSKPGVGSIASNQNPVKIASPTPPKPAFTKPRPKSPTRPARLPAAATAPTAASAAKLDGAPPSTSDRKPLNYLSTRDRAAPNPIKPPAKPTRTSLPAGSAATKTAEKSKAPKPRTSMASSKWSEGSFLERMMRPTQSSSQKTHEKVEAKTPPKKHPIRSKRMSEGSDKSKAEHVETKAGTTDEPSTSAGEPTTESTEAPSSNGIIHSVSAAAHTIPLSIPAP